MMSPSSALDIVKQLFAAYSMYADDGQDVDDFSAALEHIPVAQLDYLVAQWIRTQARPPATAELAALWRQRYGGLS